VTSGGDVGGPARQGGMGRGATASRPITNTSVYSRQGQSLGSRPITAPRSIGGQDGPPSCTGHQTLPKPQGLRVGLKRKTSVCYIIALLYFIMIQYTLKTCNNTKY